MNRKKFLYNLVLGIALLAMLAGCATPTPEFRDLNRRLLSTTGQRGLVKRIIQREGAWELLPRPDSLRDSIEALSHVDPDEFAQERERLRTHRARFRLHMRSPKRSRAQLNQLAQRWKTLPPIDSS